MQKRKHRATGKPPEQLAAERAERARAMGAASPGRPIGSRNILPIGVKDALERLNGRKYRVRKELPEEDREDGALLTGYARGRVLDVVAGKVNSRKSPSILKASIALMAEYTEPIAQAVNVNHSGSIASAVAQANQRIVAAAKPPEPT